MRLEIGDDIIIDSETTLDSDTQLKGSRHLRLKDSINISKAIEERSTLSLIVVDEHARNRFRKGQPVTVYDDNEKILYGGVIDSSSETRMANSNDLYHRINCIDWHYLADKRIVAQAFSSTLAGDIVKSLHATYLQEEGIILGTVQDGPTVSEAVFNYIPATDCLDALAEKAGFWWVIDENKRLHFVERATNKAPFAVTNLDMKRGSVEVEEGNPKYRNRQYVKGGKDITDLQTERKIGDGETQSFVLGFPVAKVPEIRVNNVSKTVGIRGVEEGKDWYWSKGDNTITQDRAGVKLVSADILEITYNGEFDIIVLTENNEEIFGRKQIEGTGTGIVEDVVDEPQFTNRTSAFQAANKKIEKYGVIGRKLKFTTWQEGLEPGQLLTVTLPLHEIDKKEMLIESVSITTEGSVNWYSVTAVEGPVSGSWAKMFYNMATSGRDFVIRENISEERTLVTLQEFTKQWTEAETPNIFKQTLPSENTFPGVYPTFREQDRVRYLAWFDGETELGRKSITQRDTTETEVFTITFLNSNEANTTMTHLGWFGGYLASINARTGVLIDKQIFDKTKTELEAIQINKTDSRW